VKQLIRTIFSPLLNLFESGDSPYLYKSSHRKILIVMGVLFVGLGSLVFAFAQGQDPAYLFPVLIFGGSGIICVVVGTVGSDRAVAKIWGSR